MAHRFALSGWIAATLVLTGAPAFAADETSPEPGAEATALQLRPAPRSAFTLRPDRNLLVAAVEVPALNLVIWGFDRFVLQAEFAKVSSETIRQNLAGGWEIDGDDLWMNFVGHPYHGALAYNAARSSGLGFWESAPAPAINSLLWEIAGEAEPPSINDLVISSAAGVLFGEAFHRISALLWDGPPPQSSHSLVAGALNPVGALNRQMFGQRRARAVPGELPPHEGGLRFGGQLAHGGGLGVRTAAHGVLGVDFTYGLSGLRAPASVAPFSVFRLRGEVGAPLPVVGALRLDGVLAGVPIAGDRAGGVWGLFASHHFDGGTGFRTAGSAVGPGAAVSLGVSEESFVRVWGMSGPVLLGGAGTFEQVDAVNRAAHLGPLYAMGPGVLGFLEAEWVAVGRGRVRAFGETGLLSASYVPGWLFSARVGAGGELSVGRDSAVGLEVRADQLRIPRAAATGWGYTGRVHWLSRFGNAPR